MRLKERSWETLGAEVERKVKEQLSEEIKFWEEEDNKKEDKLVGSNPMLLIKQDMINSRLSRYDLQDRDIQRIW